VCGLKCGQVFAEDDEVVRETDDGQSVPLGQGSRNGSFKTMQGDVGQEG